MKDEKRRHPRIEVETTDLRLLTSGGGAQPQVKIDRIIDFSLGGMKVELSRDAEAPSPNSLLDVTLAWEGISQRFDSSVRHVQPGENGRIQVGIAFDDPELVEKVLGAWYRKAAG